MKVFCPALLSGKYFPARCASLSVPGGTNTSPPVGWTDVPTATQSFVLTLIDHRPDEESIVHWVVINLPLSAREIPERASMIRDRMPKEALELRSSSGEPGYVGPKLLPGAGSHEYVFTVYAIGEKELELGPLATLSDVMLEIEDKILDSATLTAYLKT
jgi:Raf kinase inhibitor-like YbhB/YbcL family protein